MARTSISSITFLKDGRQFLASWKDRIDLFDLEGAAPQRFNTSKVFYNKNEPSVLDSRASGQEIQILARATGDEGGIVLLDLASDQEIAKFPSAVSASFSLSRPGDVLIVNKPGAPTLVQRWSNITREVSNVSLGEVLAGHFGDGFQTIQRAFEHEGGQLVLQTSKKNRVSSLKRDWSTVSLTPNLAVGPLRVIAHPTIEYCCVAGNRVITLDSGTIRFWRLSQNSVQPAGILPGLFSLCQLSPDEKSLVVIGRDNLVERLDLRTNERVPVVQPQEKVTSVAWLPDSSLLIGFVNGSVDVLRTGEPNRTISITDGPISELRVATQADAFIAVSQAQGTAYVIHNELNHGGANKSPSRLVLKHNDGQRIVTGDIAMTGRRVVTGARNGRLTIWNCEANQAVVENEADANKNSERELLPLKNKHQSKIRFVRFRKNASGQLEIFSAEESSGENEYVIWRAD